MATRLIKMLKGAPAAGVFRRVVSDKAVRASVFVFVLTRTLVLGVLIGTTLVAQKAVVTDVGTKDVTVSLNEVSLYRLLDRAALAADVNWYVGITEEGYEHIPFDAEGPHRWAFFPAFPLTLRLASAVTGEVVVTGVLLSNGFFFLALVLLYRTALLFGLDEASAGRTIFYSAAFPASYFFSLPTTESLFLLLTVGSVYAAKRGWWWVAGAAGALAAATRPNGVLLLLPLAILYLETHRTDRLSPRALALLLVPSGLAAFMIYLYVITGNPLAFARLQGLWGRHSTLFIAPLLQYLTRPDVVVVPWDFRLLNFLAATLMLVCGGLLLRRRSWALAAYALSSVLVTLSSGILQSQARYAAVVFPAFMIMAVAGRRPLLDQAARAVMLSLLVLMTLMFAARFTMALS